MNKICRVLVKASCVVFVVLGLSNASPLALANKLVATNPCPAFAPHAQNEVLAPEFEVAVMPNGVQVKGRSEFAANTPLKAFEWSFDISNCTYTTKFIEAREQAPQADLYTQVNATHSGSTASTGSYAAGVKILSEDPYNYWLAVTINKLYWTTYPNGTVQWEQHTKACQGLATPVNTHWYANNCFYGNPYYNAGNTVIYTNIAASYYNDDFMVPTLRTEAIHYSQIEAYANGTWAHTWLTNYSGEFWWLLHGEVVPEYP